LERRRTKRIVPNEADKGWGYRERESPNQEGEKDFAEEKEEKKELKGKKIGSYSFDGPM